MKSSGYSILGWIVWQIGTRVAKRKVTQNRAKLGAAGLVGLVLLGGLAATRDSGANAVKKQR
ncbi:MAG: hypothetical protein WKF29_03525 [Thermoleophilaceae bacterium]